MNRPKASCQICTLSYNITNRRPLVIVGCGHPICNYCFQEIHSLSLANKKPLLCPWDKTVLKDTTVNRFLLDLLEEPATATQREICQEHMREKAVYCLTDRTVYCLSCISDGGHKGHQFYQPHNIQEIAENRIAALEKTLGNANQTKTTIQNLCGDEENMKDYINHSFNNIRSILGQKEKDCYKKIEEFFRKEKSEIEKTSSLLFASIQNTQERLEELLKETNVIENLLETEEKKQSFSSLEIFLADQLKLHYEKREKIYTDFVGSMLDFAEAVQGLEPLTFSEILGENEEELNPHPNQETQSNENFSLVNNCSNIGGTIPNRNLNTLGELFESFSQQQNRNPTFFEILEKRNHPSMN